jgi:hypothetical protein
MNNFTTVAASPIDRLMVLEAATSLAALAAAGVAYDPVGDDDRDGIRNMDEEIVVTATPMTPEQSTAYNYHRDVATWTVNAILYGLVAKAGASGFAGALGTAAAVTNLAITDARQDMIDNNAHLNYLRDGADGRYDGRIDPRYITGEKVLPR